MRRLDTERLKIGIQQSEVHPDCGRDWWVVVKPDNGEPTIRCARCESSKLGTIVRDQAIAALQEAQPKLGVRTLGAIFGVGRTTASAALRRANPPNWRKEDTTRKLYRCRALGCINTFPGERGGSHNYSGAKAKYCPKHRGQYRDGRKLIGVPEIK